MNKEEKKNSHLDLSIPVLGNAEIESPLTKKQKFVNEDLGVFLNIFAGGEHSSNSNQQQKNITFEKAGPRQKIFFNPKTTKVAIVTCGGLCPGVNAIIRTLVRQLWNRYEVTNIVGVKFGYSGLSNLGQGFIELNPKKVEDIHMQGGTILGSSRGMPAIEEIVNNLIKNNINILFVIGGDGTMKGAKKICAIVKEKQMKISVIGIPKTIDNDIPFVDTSFGFHTAVERAGEAVKAAHEEARGHFNGIGLVKVMGRNAGFIAANAALATGVVNLCLIPEVHFTLEGENGIIKTLKKCFKEIGYAVIVIAEGAGVDLVKNTEKAYDPSGNLLFPDVGRFLKDQITKNLAKENIKNSLKYIDPSYTVRSAPPNSFDRVFCVRLAQNAVHAAMAGKTEMLIGYWHGIMTHVPFRELGQRTKRINPKGAFWFTVVESTTQKSEK